MTKGERLRGLLRSRRITIEDLAELTGYHRAYLWQVARGDRRPSKKLEAKICQVLAVDPAYFRFEPSPSRGTKQRHRLAAFIRALDDHVHEELPVWKRLIQEARQENREALNALHDPPDAALARLHITNAERLLRIIEEKL